MMEKAFKNKWIYAFLSLSVLSSSWPSFAAVTQKEKEETLNQLRELQKFEKEKGSESPSMGLLIESVRRFSDTHSKNYPPLDLQDIKEALAYQKRFKRELGKNISNTMSDILIEALQDQMTRSRGVRTRGFRKIWSRKAPDCDPNVLPNDVLQTATDSKSVAKKLRVQQAPENDYSETMGLMNRGNTCYMNSSLKMMAAHPEIRKLTQKLPEVGENEEENKARDEYRAHVDSLMTALQRDPDQAKSLIDNHSQFHTDALRAIHEARENPYLPQFHPFVPGRPGVEIQHDADEYLKAALTTLNYDEVFPGFRQRDELKSADGKTWYTAAPVVDPKAKKTVSTHGSVITIDPTEIQNSNRISQSARGVLEPTEVDDYQLEPDQRGKKGRRGAVVKKPIRVVDSVDRVPKYLFANLSSRRLLEEEKQLLVDPLESSFTVEKTLESDHPMVIKAHYDPIAIVVHRGGTDGGHYLEYNYDSQKKAWFSHNDHSVTRLRGKELTAALASGKTGGLTPEETVAVEDILAGATLVLYQARSAV